ncbi:hypothetical protein [Alteromonas gilva]|uniref:DUF304 domain-containing protein n=1 Tax=Alteromonas gilva TaxID=2987522 RepID=A0ABT5L743_9ALTE|nr:hypothetical protein [Alteromonas gilva]MDC8832870.1 hypothetical protein [Alteromonas gilva]
MSIAYKYRFDYYLLLSHPIYLAFSYLAGAVLFGYALLTTYHAIGYSGLPTIWLLIPALALPVAPFFRRSLNVDEKGGLTYIRQDLWKKKILPVDSISIHQEKKYGALELHHEGGTSVTDIVLLMDAIENERSLIARVQSAMAENGQ